MQKKIWIVPDNVRDSVEASQPLTYGQRVALALLWQHCYAIQVPILVDSPDNLFWKAFGQAPNMAYLIQPNG